MPISLSQVLSVVLALAVVYYVLGLVVSAITHYAVEILNTRGKSLEGFLKKRLLGMAEDGKSELLDLLKETPQISSLKPVRYEKTLGFIPSGFFTGKTAIINYVERIPPKNLVDALFDISGTISEGENRVRKIIECLPKQLPGPKGPEDFKIRADLLKLAESGFNNVDELRAKMETWFTGLMEQASQEFRAQARRIVITLSLVVTLLFGVDSIELAKMYWKNAAISATADAQASLIISATDKQNQDNADIQKLVKQLEDMQAINYKWYKYESDTPNVPLPPFSTWLALKILGLLITALAVSQGSSFWYDLIKQLKGDQSTPQGDSEVVIEENGRKTRFALR
jgi:hypothetical protein